MKTRVAWHIEHMLKLFGSVSLRRRMISSGSLFSTNSHFSRKELLPLIKKIHPDLYHSEGPEVREGNLRCIQDLYELFDFLGSYHASIANRYAIVGRLAPLQPRYDLSFYVRRETEAETDMDAVARMPGNKPERSSNGDGCALTLTPVRVSVTPLAALSSRDAGAQLSGTQKTRAVQALQGQLEGVFRLADLALPWPVQAGAAGAAGVAGAAADEFDWVSSRSGTGTGAAEAGRGMEGGSDHDRARRLGVDLAAVDQAVVERYLRLSLLTPYRGGALGSAAQQQLWVQAEVQAFLRDGHILLRGFTKGAEDEARAVQKLCAFLEAHAQTLNFSCQGWSDVIVVLSGGESSSNSGRRSASEKADNGKRRKKRNQPESYSVTAVGSGQHAVLELPWDFRASLLMDALAELPQARDPAFARMRS